MIPGILIAGIGNIFLGDDAFGCEVTRVLSSREQPEGVRVFDFGIRGFDLTYALLDGPETVILVDATQRGKAPGTVYVIEPELSSLHESDAEPLVEMHGMDPVKVLHMVRSMGGQFHRVLLVGCEPQSFGSEDEGEGRIGLSRPVEAAVGEAVRLIESLVADILMKDKQKLEVIK